MLKIGLLIIEKLKMQPTTSSTGLCIHHTQKKKKKSSSTGLCLKRLLGYTQTIPLHIKDYSTENKKEIQIQIPLPRNVTCPGIFYFSWYYVIFFGYT